MKARMGQLLTKLRAVVEDIEGINEEETLELVTYLLEHPPKEKITFPITLYKSVAELLWLYNTNNRNAVDARIRSLCRTLLRDKIEYTHQGIAVAYESTPDGIKSVVLDGQKRILMVIRMGVSVKVDITFGLSTEVFHAIDDTQPRGVAQTFTRMEKRPNANSQVAAIRAVARVIAGTSVKPQTTDDCDDWLRLFDEHLDWSMGVLLSASGFRTAELMAAMAVGHYLHPDEAETFIHQIVTGESLKQGDPALTLRHALLTTPKKNRRAGGNNPQIIVQMTLNAFMGFVNKEKVLRSSTSTIGLLFFRKALMEKKKVRDLVKFWKITGSTTPESTPEEPLVH